jgi:hypothetical protein
MYAGAGCLLHVRHGIYMFSRYPVLCRPSLGTVCLPRWGSTCSKSSWPLSRIYYMLVVFSLFITVWDGCYDRSVDAACRPFGVFVLSMLMAALPDFTSCSLSSTYSSRSGMVCFENNTLAGTFASFATYRYRLGCTRFGSVRAPAVGHCYVYCYRDDSKALVYDVSSTP